MNQKENTAPHPIYFTSSSKIKEYIPGIIETMEHQYTGKHLYGFHSTAFNKDSRYLEAIQNGNNKELNLYLNNKGFDDVEFISLEGWKGLEEIFIKNRFGWEG
ncbi:hypothetical protein [Nostoc sp.]|uniref:hypothetical protein n=1 Tax=Nostoc sp. TaxID=1180 RepID=UPI002FF89518